MHCTARHGTPRLETPVQLHEPAPSNIRQSTGMISPFDDDQTSRPVPRSSILPPNILHGTGRKSQPPWLRTVPPLGVPVTWHISVGLWAEEKKKKMMSWCLCDPVVAELLRRHRTLSATSSVDCYFETMLLAGVGRDGGSFWWRDGGVWLWLLIVDELTILRILYFPRLVL